MRENNIDWDAYVQAGLEFSEDDKKLIGLMTAYDEARQQLLGKESDSAVLWRTIIAADAMRKQLGMMP